MGLCSTTKPQNNEKMIGIGQEVFSWSSDLIIYELNIKFTEVKQISEIQTSVEKIDTFSKE